MGGILGPLEQRLRFYRSAVLSDARRRAERIICLFDKNLRIRHAGTRLWLRDASTIQRLVPAEDPLLVEGNAPLA